MTTPQTITPEQMNAFSREMKAYVARTSEYPEGRHSSISFINGPHFNRHEQRLEKACEAIREAITNLSLINEDRNARSRQISLAITHLEEAMMRIDRIAFIDSERWQDFCQSIWDKVLVEDADDDPGFTLTGVTCSCGVSFDIEEVENE